MVKRKREEAEEICSQFKKIKLNSGRPLPYWFIKKKKNINFENNKIIEINEDLKSETKTLEGTIEELSDEVDELNSMVADLNETISAREDELDDLNYKIGELEDRLHSLQMRTDEYE